MIEKKTPVRFSTGVMPEEKSAKKITGA